MRASADTPREFASQSFDTGQHNITLSFPSNTSGGGYKWPGRGPISGSVPIFPTENEKSRTSSLQV